ncbi:TrkH family potassium uptake protein [Teredinibacter waterburyi]|uniref:TrkH family potassium uptake protein n=1 Tax=Teredinibacter waterburyi TaxID=1500538 RepID=UPI001CAA81BD|nr:potassium transporter TrkG [Teredinibacter waterburyi]
MVINRSIKFYLLAFPVGLMGLVQAVFALLSLLVFHDHEETQFFIPAASMLMVSVFLFSFFSQQRLEKITPADSMLFATLTWVLVGLLGALPIIEVTGVSLTDGVFESVSALTTTGATVLSNLDGMPKSFLLYRQFLQWLGGLGVVIFVVAVLPVLNVGGMKLLRAETPGPIKDDKVSPRVASSAHYLWVVYISISIACTICYYLVGMSFYDAIAHSFTTVSTGGFSTHDASLGYFKSGAVLIVSDIFMLMGAISFALHFRNARQFNLMSYWRDEETRYFLLTIVLISGVIFYVFMSQDVYTDYFEGFNQALFHLISFITSTGYGAAAYTEWPMVVIALLVLSGYLGGCAGSTAGGNKFIRNILFIKIIGVVLTRINYPNAITRVRFQSHPVEESVLSATVAFLSVVVATALILILMMMATGLDFWSAFTAVSACLNVVGPAFGSLGNNFQPVSDAGTWILSASMILGRLEYFTVLALLLPEFWRS